MVSSSKELKVRSAEKLKDELKIVSSSKELKEVGFEDNSEASVVFHPQRN